MLAGPFTGDLCGFIRVLHGNLFTPPVPDESDALWPLTTPLSYHYQHISGIPLLLQAGAFGGDLRPVAFCGGHLAQGKLCTCRCSSFCPLPLTCHWACSSWPPAHSTLLTSLSNSWGHKLNCPVISFPLSSIGIGASLWVSAAQQVSGKEMRYQSPFLQTTPLYVSFLRPPTCQR